MKKVLVIAFISIFGMALGVSAKEIANTEAKVSTSTEFQSNTTLKGVVFDKLTNESLAGAVVTANGQKVYTDLDGNFTVKNVCNGKCKLTISLISYADQTMEVDTENPSQLKIQLSQR